MDSKVEYRLGVGIRRDVKPVLFPFRDYFQGFENVGAVRSVFGAETEKVLSDLKVEFFSSKWGYMSTSDVDGHLIISSHHLKNSDFETVYLDVVHELCHVKQFMDGRVLFDARYGYADSPVEIEAYRITVDEAKRIGFTEDRIREYLRVEWMSEEELQKLIKNIGLQ
jgi:hypothetical protein